MVAGEKKEVVVEKETREEVITAVYKLHLHCKDCARHVEKTIIRTQGIHKVDIEVETGKVSVKGVFDPVKIHKRIEKKTKKKVELISPKPKEKVDKPPEKKEEKKKEEVVKTTVIKVHMHCKNCEYDLETILLKLKGVHTVKMNRDAQTCTVVGTIEEKKLIEYIRKKAHKRAEIVPQKIEKKVEKEEEKKKVEVKDGKEKVEVVKEKEEVKSKEIVVPYFIHCTHAPDWLSDENPNACSVM
ncbi:heavy metal-associated isoprenylated plant protein 4 [Elaeis guineensis]|uniref:Heavy metal-associated isoprenylated plant protein 4 n=1 Tax=Elaeis guineensis var. tenera TaxID=51953 RepID=A0A6J0PP85_ELAGV|nr:heavy metal-associated isoprenylated plant protein 4 [Elaeis guineensis]